MRSGRSPVRPLRESPDVGMPESPIQGWPGVVFDTRTEVECARMAMPDGRAETA